MFRYLVRRLLQMILVFVATTLVVYALMYASAVDPVQALAGERPIDPAQKARLIKEYGLDQPFFVRYWNYLTDLLRGDFGQSLTGRSINEIIAESLPVSAQLAVIAILTTILIGVTAGIVAAMRRGGIFDNSTLVFTLIIIGIPVVVLAPVAQLLFTIKLPWFPTTAREGTLYSYLLPGIILGALSVATAMRLTRASFTENARSDYVRTARSKGLPKRRIVGVHILRNSLIPIVTFLGIELGALMAGAIVTEGVFNVNGVGFQLARALRTEDAPLVVGLVSVLVIIFLLANLIVDILYAVLDPRIRYE
jgi:ABC-type dipeptide/oligopeptide/nickel transport system permease component